jgi:hypothetical protein
MLKNKAGKVVSVLQLAKAIRNSTPHADMSEDDANVMAEHILNFFGYNERIIDNALEPEDRDAFYILEDAGILSTEREETTLYDGREWRIHYWLFCKDKITELASPKMLSKFRPRDEMEDHENIYEDIPEDIWNVKLESEKKP